MVQYDEEMTQIVNDNVDLLEYVGQNIELKQKGKEYFGNCPLHVDETPSFSITPKKNQFYCFSCGRGGGIVQYLASYEGLTYADAMTKGANLAQVDLKALCQSETVKYNRQLKKVASKKMSEPTHKILERYEFDRYREGVVDEWLNEGIRQEELELFEIRIDERSNRIVYPVYDMSGNLINVKGRTRFKDYKKLGISKYINYFPVGVVDYFQGLNITLPYVKKSKELKIFESIKSVMKLFRYGIRDSGSAEKHDLSPEQIKWIIMSGIEDVVLCYDSDITYREKSVQKNIKALKQFVNLYVIRDTNCLLGGKEGKNSPIDLGIEVWNALYETKQKII